MMPPGLREDQVLDGVEQMLARGEVGAAVERLLAVLDRRGVAGDAACALAARALRVRMGGETFAPDAMAATLDRMAALVRQQDDQIRALQALVEMEL